MLRRVAVGAIALFLCAAYAHATDLVIGVTQGRLLWMKADEREEVIESLTDSGVGYVRVGLHQPFADALDVVADLDQRGVKVLLMVSLNQKVYFPPGAKLRSGLGRIDNGYRLSDIDVDRFTAQFAKFWATAEKRNVKIYAVQVGNEINSTFNGDLPARERQNGQLFSTVAEMPEGDKFSAGMDRYIAVVKAVKSVRDDSLINRDSKIISAGMARLSSKFAQRAGATAIDSAVTLSLLSRRGLDQLIDARAMHLYPRSDATPRQRKSALSQAIADCTISTSKPCWLTEWGFNNTAKTCPVDDGSRSALVEETRENMDKLALTGKLSAAFYFEWDGTSPRSVWRCGGLTEAGKAVIERAD